MNHTAESATTWTRHSRRWARSSVMSKSRKRNSRKRPTTVSSDETRVIKELDLTEDFVENPSRVPRVRNTTAFLTCPHSTGISTWQDDKEAEGCSACEKPFSVSRRRHHCRKCGQIFCGQCSEGSMPLIRGGKPVRVCDACQQELLQMYSVNSAAVQPRGSSLKSPTK